jgi:protein O-mannosyl-transferase
MSDEQNFFETNRELIVFTILAAFVLVVYWQVTGFDLINLDDNLYVYDNPAVLSGLNSQSIRWAFTAFHSANWHPLTWLSHMLDVQMFGMSPGRFHATSVILHLINSCLAFAVFQRLTGSFVKSAIVATLFAVHPAHVESVAWIAERKDMLSTLFWLLTMAAYAGYAQPKGETNERTGDSRGYRINPSYVLVIVVFALGLMAKPMLVTLPFVLLLLDYWPLDRLKTLKDLPRLLIEKIPLFALSAASSYITVLAQGTVNAVESLEALPLGPRLVNAMLAYTKYVGMLFYPSPLAVWYPYDRNFPVWQLVLAAMVLLGITLICLSQLTKRKYLLTGWLWFLGTLVPVIGIVQVGGQALADRYTYIPFFGLFIMLVWGAGDLFEKFKLGEKAFVGLFAAASVILAVASFNQAALWRNTETLYRHTLAVTRNNYLISHNLCHYFMNQNRLDEATPLCRDSIAINPRYSNGYNTLGIVQIKAGQTAEAEQTFLKSLEVAPDNGLAYANLAVAQAILGKPEEAEANLQKAAFLSAGTIPPEVWIHSINDIAFAYNSKGNYEKAAEHMTRLLSLVPNDLPARGNLALVLSKLKRFAEAEQQIGTVLQAAPDDPNAHNTFGLILLEQNRNAEAAAQFQKALDLKPDYSEAADNLKKANGEK